MKKLTHMEEGIVKYLEWFEFFTQESKKKKNTSVEI